MAVIKLEECPSSVVNYYDRRPSAQRVKRVSANVTRNGDVRYTVTHSFGWKDVWEFVDHEWRVVKTVGP